MDQFVSALIITVVGMGFVFLFLAIQVLVTNLASKFGAKFSYMLPEPEKKKPAAPKAPAAAASNDAEIVAAIAAAMTQAN